MKKASLKFFVVVVMLGYCSAIPFYDNNFDTDTSFVPLEQQEHTESQQTRTEKPFDVDFIATDIDSTDPAAAFGQTFPFFGTNLFSTFGGFGFGFEPSIGPWWKGTNVCKKQTKEEGDVQGENNANNTKKTDNENEAELHFTVNTCVEKVHKYECTKSITKNGRRHTETTILQCCRGYGRAAHATDSTAPCEKLEVKNLEETADEIGCKDFVASVKASNMNELLANQKELTIFMPLDQSFKNYKHQIQSDHNSVDAKIEDDMKYLIERHILDHENSLYDLKNDQMLKTLDSNQEIRFNSFLIESASPRQEDIQYAANCIPIKKHDILTEQGLVHTLEGVIKPVTKNLMDIIRERSDLSIMRRVLEKTNLSKLLEGKNPTTIFVPTDGAFAKLDPNFRKTIMEGKGCASNIIKNHILDFTFCSLAVVPRANTSVHNILGDVMHLEQSRGNTNNSEVNDLVGETKAGDDDETYMVVINSISKIIETDIMGTNGVIHIVDTILPTDSALPLTSLMEQKGATLFRKLVAVSGLDDQLNDMTNITLLAPTDKAINHSKWADYLNKSPEQLRDNSELSDFIKYHIYKPRVKTCDLNEEVLKSVAGLKLRINLYSTHPFFTNLMNRATVNCARMVHFDDESCDSILHQVDKVLEPPTMNLLQMLEANPNYSKFLELVQIANLSYILERSEDDFTLLVPKNEVFDYITDWEEFLSKNKSEVNELVKDHIVNDVVCCAAIIPVNWPFTRTVETINGSRLRLSRERRPTIQNAGITKCDTVASNGIIHEINDVIVPPLRFRTGSEDQLETLFF